MPAPPKLKKYRDMEADGLLNIDWRNAKGDRVGAFDLEEIAKTEAAMPTGLRRQRRLADAVANYILAAARIGSSRAG